MSDESASDSDALVPPEELTGEYLLSLFQRAYFEASLDDDGDICVRERFVLYVMPGTPRHRLKFHTQFTLQPLAVEQGLALDVVNRINTKYIVVKAFTYNNSLILQHDLVTRAGATGRQIIQTFKLFESVVCDVMSGELRSEILEVLAQ